MMKRKIRYYMPILIILAMMSIVSASGVEVEIGDVNNTPTFIPENITILQGTTVNWTNNNEEAHTVTSNTGAFDSGTLNPGESFNYTFNNTGTFGYYCIFHSFMHGNVTVIPALYNISGYKINDINGNRRWDSSNPIEKGVPNWNITLTNATTGIEIVNTTTNNNGLYNFNVTNGVYIVTEEIKEGWVNTTAVSRQVTVAGSDVIRQDFLNQLNDTIPPVINSVILDTINPTIGQAIIVTVNATDNVGIVNVTANNVRLAYIGSNTWNGTIIAEEGNHSVNISATDFRGNVAWNNSTVYTGIVQEDTTPPIINSIVLDNYTPYVGTDIHITVNATDNIGVTNVTTNNTEFIHTVDPNIWIWSIVSKEGNQPVNISAKDAAGNIVWKNVTYTGIVRDATPPTINSVELSTLSPFTGDDILVTVNVTDNIGVINVTADSIELVWQAGNIYNGTIIAEAGIHSVNVSAKDAAGNKAWNNATTYTGTNRSIIFEFVVDRQTVSVNQSEDALYVLTINNTGQVNDTSYNLTIDNPNNANVSISQRNISLDKNSLKTINLTVNSSTTGTYIVNVTAVSRANPLLNKTVSTRTNVLSPVISRLNMSANPTNVTTGTPTNVTFAVTSAGVAISGATVILSGVATGTGITDTNGSIVIGVNATGAGTITATASKAGFINGSTNLTANIPGAPSLNILTTLTNVTIVPTNVTFTVTSVGAAIGGATVTLSGVATGIGTTDSNGSAVISVNATSTGTITATASKVGFISGTITINAISIIVWYDTNHDGIIQKSEAIQAVVDYFANRISKQNAITVVVAYFSG